MSKALALALVLLIASSFYNVKLSDAQTVAEWKILPTPESIEPIKISIISPENLSSFTSNSITLIFDATAPKPDSFPNLESNAEWSFYNWVWSYYNASWLSANDNYKECNLTGSFDALKGNVTIQNIPAGNHHLEIGVGGLYQTERTLLTATGYRLFSSAPIYFTILPTVTIISIENKTYTSSKIDLNYTVNEPISKITYSIDGKNNETIYGNVTLPELSNGVHNVTVYAWDVAGNAATSETAYFSVKAPESFPVVPIAAVSTLAIALAVAGLLVYHKKRK